MIGTFANSRAILVGSLIGIAAGRRVPERIKTIIMQGLGLSVMLIGLQMALTGKEILLTVGCLLIGGVTTDKESIWIHLITGVCHEGAAN